MFKNHKVSTFVFTISLVLTLFLATFPVTAQSLTTGWLTHPDHPPAQVRLMLTGEVDHENNKAKTLLEVKLNDDWKTYWRSPGEGGVAPILDWSQSTNINELTWYWPTPAYYEQSGLWTLGYKSNVIFPMELTFNDVNQPFNFSGKLTLPTCTNICVLTEYDLSLPSISLTDLKTNTENQHLYQQGFSTVPTETNNININVASFDKLTQQLQIQLQQDGIWQNPQILIDGNEITDDYFSQPSITIDNNIVTATYKVTNWLGKADLIGKSITITVSDSLFSHELTTIVDNKPLQKSTSTNIYSMIGFAILGGLILNIMPCVLPVLGMKLNSMIASSQTNKRTIRLHFFASAAGILTSFWLIAASLFLLKITGNAIGWGIQFQNPFFIGFMFVITALFTANLLGLFEIQLPSRLSTSIANKGKNSTSGHFIQGMFATLLATPCSAPFLGTAVAFALGASIFEMWLIFTFLGLGMALPWIILAIFPHFISFMPKPGNWMNHVKTIFGLMMFITTLWLLSLLSPFIGNQASIVIAILLSACLLYRIKINHHKNTLLLIVIMIITLSSTAFFIASMTTKSWASPIEDNLTWHPLNTTAIDEYVQQGKTVFVDVTADWCITCKANKFRVILQNPVYSALQKPELIAMKGDWTHPSTLVTDYLKSHQRFGVPLNVVYGPNAPQGIALPVLLTNDDVMQALKLAGKQP